VKFNTRHRKNLRQIIGAIFALACFLASSNLFAEMFIHQLKYQQGSQIIPVIKPHLSESTVISAKDYKLFIQSTPQEYEKIKSMLIMLDKKPGQYMVEVKILSRKLDNWELKQTQITASNEQVSGKITRYQSGSNRDNEKLFSLRLIEGYQGFVNTGESFMTNQLVNHYGSFLPQSGYKKVTSGFYVSLNETNNNLVRIAVSAQAQNRQSNNSQNINQSATTSYVTGNKGDWILLATINDTQTNKQSSQYSTESSRSNKRWYYIRVNDIAN